MHGGRCLILNVNNVNIVSQYFHITWLRTYISKSVFIFLITESRK